MVDFSHFYNFLDLIAARNAGLTWTTTTLPIKQVNLVAPTQPVHSPFLSWAPPNLVLTPNEPATAPIEVRNDAVEVEVAQEPEEDLGEIAPVAAPFRLGPVPPINRTIIPTGVNNPIYPHGSVTNMVRRGDVQNYTGPDCYVWDPVVSIF